MLWGGQGSGWGLVLGVVSCPGGSGCIVSHGERDVQGYVRSALACGGGFAGSEAGQAVMRCALGCR